MAKKTQVGVGGLPGRRYGSFAGKEEAIASDLNWVKVQPSDGEFTKMQAADGEWKKIQDNN